MYSIRAGGKLLPCGCAAVSQFPTRRLHRTWQIIWRLLPLKCIFASIHHLFWTFSVFGTEDRLLHTCRPSCPLRLCQQDIILLGITGFTGLFSTSWRAIDCITVGLDSRPEKTLFLVGVGGSRSISAQTFDARRGRAGVGQCARYAGQYGVSLRRCVNSQRGALAS